MSKKIATLICSASLTWALAQDSTKSQNLVEVIVTANKVEQKQNTTGKTVTVINKATIEKNAGKTVAQLLNEQAGVGIVGSLNNLGTPQSVFMRGANNGRALILVDGIPVNDPSQINAEFDLNLFNLNDVEKIEVCRGAESTLYGSDAVAGVINIITIKKDVKTPFNVNYTGSVGNLNTVRNNIQVYGKLNKLNYQVRAANLSSGGFSSAYDKTDTFYFDRDSYNGTTANANINYAFNKNFSARSFVQYSRYKANVDNSAFKDDRDFTITNKTLNTGFGLNYKKEGINVVANYQYTQNDRLFVNDSTHVGEGAKYVNNPFFSKAQFVELYSSLKLTKNLTLLQGADYRFSNMNSNYLSVSSFGPFVSSFKDTSMSQGSMYASLLFNTDKWNIEAGSRLNVHSRFGSNRTYTFTTSYKMNEKYRVFAGISSGFKAPSLYQLYDDFAGNENLKPEQSTNIELGIQYAAKNLNVRIVGFNRKVTNGIDFDYIGFKYFNFAQQRVNGLEVEASINLTNKLTASGNLTLLNPKENTQSRISLKDTSYSILLRRALQMGNFNLNYSFSDNFSVSVTTRLVGHRYDGGGFGKADVGLKGYALVGLYTEYKLNQKLKFFADAQNLFNTQFFDLNGYNSIPLLVSGGVTVKL